MDKYIAVVWTKERDVQGQWRYELTYTDSWNWAQGCMKARKFEYQEHFKFTGDLGKLGDWASRLNFLYGHPQLKKALESIFDYFSDPERSSLR